MKNFFKIILDILAKALAVGAVCAVIGLAVGIPMLHLAVWGALITAIVRTAQIVKEKKNWGFGMGSSGGGSDDKKDNKTPGGNTPEPKPGLSADVKNENVNSMNQVDLEEDAPAIEEQADMDKEETSLDELEEKAREDKKKELEENFGNVKKDIDAKMDEEFKDSTPSEAAQKLSASVASMDGNPPSGADQKLPVKGLRGHPTRGNKRQRKKYAKKVENLKN